jgi:SulP family sulfate permease
LLPGVLLFRVESPLVYFNVSYVYNHVWPKITASASSLKVVIFDLSTSAYVDSSGARLIKKLFLDLESQGIIFKVAEAHSEVRDILRFEDVEHLLGHVGRRDSMHEVIVHTLTEVEMREKLKENSQV